MMIATLSPVDRADRAAPADAALARRVARPRGELVLERYQAPDGAAREVVRCLAAAGSALVVDRCSRGAPDERLVAHLAADEPFVNAAVVCMRYVAERRSPRPCSLPRALGDDDRRSAPLPDAPGPRGDGAAPTHRLVDHRGCRHHLGAVTTTALAIPELRWLRDPPTGTHGPAELVSVRDVVGALQDYEPACSLTAEAIRRHRDDARLSVAVLRTELARVGASPIVLNRRLRELVVQALARDGLSMSEIAARCGRVKRDRRGNVSGETSWLARRLGLLPEGGERVPTPWIHSAVLALIARRGLGLSPREVEL